MRSRWRNRLCDYITHCQDHIYVISLNMNGILILGYFAWNTQIIITISKRKHIFKICKQIWSERITYWGYYKINLNQIVCFILIILKHKIHVMVLKILQTSWFIIFVYGTQSMIKLISICHFKTLSNK